MFSKPIVWLAISFVFLSGCGHPDNLLCFESYEEKEVIPKSLVGVWVSEDNKWGLKISPDGRILKLKHNLAGQIDVVNDGGAFYEGTKEGTYAEYILGTCSLEYDQEQSYLTVSIVVDYFHMELPAGSLEGKCEDIFKGTYVQGKRLWEAEWLNYSWLDGAKDPDKDIIDANPESVRFQKLNIFE